MPAWMDRLKTKWGIASTGQVLIILIVFSLAGSSVTRIRRVFWPLFGFTSETSLWIQVPTYIALIFPTYQVMLMLFGTLFGQFRFFWEKEKAMFRFFGRLFSGRSFRQAKQARGPERRQASAAAGRERRL